MELVIANMSAADFWRFVYPPRKTPDPPAPANPPAQLAVNDEDVWSLAPAWVTTSFLEPERGTLHVLTFDRGVNRKSAAHVTHQWTAPLPDGSLYNLGNDAYVCSPAFTFLQLAQHVDPIELVAYGCELCGTYALSERAERGFVTRVAPLITADQLRSYVEGAQSVHGCKRALWAIDRIVEGAASPRETYLALLLTMPYRNGGYGFARPLMNQRIDLAPAAASICGKRYLRVDLCYPRQRLAVEYLGARDHQGAEAMRSDRGRTNALEEMGYEVIELTSEQVDDPVAFAAIAERIARRIKKRVKVTDLESSAACSLLRRTLARWHVASGRPAVR